MVCEQKKENRDLEFGTLKTYLRSEGLHCCNEIKENCDGKL